MVFLQFARAAKETSDEQSLEKMTEAGRNRFHSFPLGNMGRAEMTSETQERGDQTRASVFNQPTRVLSSAT